MSSLADRSIAALTEEHAVLAAIAASLDDDQLAGPSGAAQWPLRQVFSHLGSGAEIMVAGLRGALGAEPAGEDVNQGVWDRWNAMSAREQLDGFLVHDSTLLDALSGLDPQQRESIRIEVGFLPDPLSVASFAGMRLNEVAQHSWDVRIALDPHAVVAEDSASTLFEHYRSGLAFMLGFVGKADQIAEPAVVDMFGYGLSISDSVSLAAADATADATATFSGTQDAAVRLIGGRLAPEHTPGDVAVTGNVSLDDLRRVFPGF